MSRTSETGKEYLQAALTHGIKLSFFSVLFPCINHKEGHSSKDVKLCCIADNISLLMFIEDPLNFCENAEKKFVKNRINKT
jgi:hypothetical protein